MATAQPYWNCSPDCRIRHRDRGTAERCKASAAEVIEVTETSGVVTYERYRNWTRWVNEESNCPSCGLEYCWVEDCR